jgi:hypothetical protein
MLVPPKKYIMNILNVRSKVHVEFVVCGSILWLRKGREAIKDISRVVVLK